MRFGRVLPFVAVAAVLATGVGTGAAAPSHRAPGMTALGTGPARSTTTTAPSTTVPPAPAPTTVAAASVTTARKPAPTTTTVGTTVGTTPPAASPEPTATAAAPAATTATATAQQHGMTSWAYWPTAYGEQASDDALAQLRSIGVTWVVLVPTWFQATATSGTFAAVADFTPTDASLLHAATTARRLGLHVTIKPHVNVSDGTWRGAIVPADPAAWWSTYERFAVHYAGLARSAGADQFVVGTELAGVSPDAARWRRVIAAVRARFTGKLTYAALPFEYQKITFWDTLDSIGVDAYWKLSALPTTDVAALRRAWAPIATELQAVSQQWHRPILFTEAGYASQVGCATDPSSWSLSTTPAPLEQAAAYQALLDTFSAKPWFAGVNWWAWRVTNLTDPLDFTPEGKPAESLLAARWA